MARGKRFVSFSGVVDLLGEGRRAQRRRSASLRVLVGVSAEADEELARSLRLALMPEQPGCDVIPLPLGELPVALAAPADLVVILPDKSGELAYACARVAAAQKTRCCVVVDSVLESRDAELGEGSSVRYLVAATPAAALSQLAAWVVSACPESGTALAASFPFLRGERAKELIGSCALQNAAIGAVDLMPGADLPVMVMNQLKMSLELSASYGRGLGVEQLADLAVVVAASLASRGVARRLCRLAPGLSWVIRGGVGYAGTYLVGKGLSSCYAGSDRLSSTLGDLRSQLQGLAGRAQRRGADDGAATGGPDTMTEYLQLEGERT